MAHLLEILGIDGLRPVALLERRRGPLRGIAWFVSTWIDAPDLLSVGMQRKLCEAELAALDTLLRQMLAARLSHGDFKANNLLLRDDRLAIIDLDSMRPHDSPEDSAVFAQVAATIAGVRGDPPPRAG
jgi:Ser/Thr protein kinase RdoA (MazF antagonist)